MLLKACASGAAFAGRVATTTTSLSATTYLFQLGVLTLDRQGGEYHSNKEVGLVVPNASVSSNYAQAFLEYHTGQFGSASACLHDPTVTSLDNVLKTLMTHQHWGGDQTVADLQALLTAEFVVFSQRPGVDYGVSDSQHHLQPHEGEVQDRRRRAPAGRSTSDEVHGSGIGEAGGDHQHSRLGLRSDASDE